jgi:hypothetical protein
MIALWGCEEAPQETAAPAEAEAPPEPIDGQTAFFRMFPAARSWAPDAQGVRLESMEIEEVPSEDGKYGAWRATFYSPAKNLAAVFNYAVVEVGGKIQKGVFTDHEESFTPGRTKAWSVSALKVESAKALATAMEQDKTKAYVKENPDMPIFVLLEQTNRHPNLAYRIVWGESVSRSGFSVFVDASTGEFLEVLR